MRKGALFVGVAVVVTALFSGAAPARAEDAQKARELFQQGTTYYDLGQFDKAIESWQAGYREKADPGFLYNIAQAYRVAGDPQKAIFFYKGYLRNSPKAHNRVEVEQKIAALQKQIDEKSATPAAPPPAAKPTTPPPPVAVRPQTAPPPAAAPPATTTPPATEPSVVVTSPQPFGEPSVPPPGPPGVPPVISAEVPPPAPGPSGTRIDVLASIGVDAWSSGVQGTADPSFAFTLGGGYRFGDPGARYRFRLGALFGYTFLKETDSKEHFLSFLIDPTLEVRLGARWLLTGDLGIGVLAITGLKPTSALLVQEPGDMLMVNGTQGLFLVRLGVGVHYDVLPELSVFVWPAVASSPKKEHFYKQISRTEILFGAAYRF